ncbi:MAG: type II toxin-antitoxin system VapC family toxin [Leptolyngbyaceae cyanobacterium RM2_2_4]|nr:type II toxin-antitoxin system VapC family toxin [Leptolyngbyaceae cyanobacterium RM2_2_4]
MEWLIRLQDQTVGLDTAPLIYFIEQNEIYLDLVRAFFQAMNQGEFRVVTSTLTLTEVLVHPIRAGNIKLAAQYREIISDQANLTALPVSFEIAETAAHIRARHNLRTPDAIQIATAIRGRASFFLTNDVRLVDVPDLEVLALDNLLGE